MVFENEPDLEAATLLLGHKNTDVRVTAMDLLSQEEEPIQRMVLHKALVTESVWVVPYKSGERAAGYTVFTYKVSALVQELGFDCTRANLLDRAARRRLANKIADSEKTVEHSESLEPKSKSPETKPAEQDGADQPAAAVK